MLAIAVIFLFFVDITQDYVDTFIKATTGSVLWGLSTSLDLFLTPESKALQVCFQKGGCQVAGSKDAQTASWDVSCSPSHPFMGLHSLL